MFPFQDLRALIDLGIGPSLVPRNDTHDNKGFKHPHVSIDAAHERAFTLELAETLGRVNEAQTNNT